MVDLSKCRVGNTIKRRDGTTHLVTAIRLITEGNPIHPIRIDYDNCTRRYMKNGLYYEGTTCDADICEVIPKETECVKPPLELMPRNIWIEGRVTDIIDTLNQFRDTPKNIKIEWIRELTELLEELD